MALEYVPTVHLVAPACGKRQNPGNGDQVESLGYFAGAFPVNNPAVADL
jgi:hypothetical protein